MTNTHTPKPHWLDESKNIKLLWYGFITVLAITVLAELFINLHPAFAIEGWFGFHAAFGFIACALMILGAKLLGVLIKRPDTYYANKENADE